MQQLVYIFLFQFKNKFTNKCVVSISSWSQTYTVSDVYWCILGRLENKIKKLFLWLGVSLINF